MVGRVAGVPVNIYRANNQADRDSSSLSNTKDTLVLVTPKADPVKYIKKGEDYLILQKGPAGTLRAVPKSLSEKGRWVSFGGNFCFSEENSFRRISEHPIKIFDKVL